jgi:hypothetical protein
MICLGVVSLSKSNLIASRESWNVTRPLLESLTDERLANAANQAAQHKPVTDAGVRKLLGMISSIGSTAPGSEEKKSYELAQLKSSVVHFGVPVIYLTFNPGENSSPIALLYAGEDIDVKAFSPQLYAVGERLKTMLDNPLAVVEYFHNTINTIIQTLLKGGMFGDLVHHYGPVEYLGRGPPHTHLVVYILQSMYSADDLVVDQGHHRSRSDS